MTRKLALTPQVWRYLISGGSAFAIEYLAFAALLKWTDITAGAINVASFCLGLVVSFSMQRLYTFKHQSGDARGVKRQLPQFAALAIFNIVVTTAIIDALPDNHQVLLAVKIVLMVSIAVWNYFIYKYLIFKRSSI